MSMWDELVAMLLLTIIRTVTLITAVVLGILAAATRDLTYLTWAVGTAVTYQAATITFHGLSRRWTR